jgi:hypothetical protein
MYIYEPKLSGSKSQTKEQPIISRASQDNSYYPDQSIREIEGYRRNSRLYASTNGGFGQLLSLAVPPTCGIDLTKKNKIGFEFDMLVSITTDLCNPTPNSLNKKLISHHKDSIDGFTLKIDGNKIEVSTKPFELTEAGRKELEKTFSNINQWLNDLKTVLNDPLHQKKIKGMAGCLKGEGIFIGTKDTGKKLNLTDEFINTNHFILPLKSAIANRSDYFTENLKIRGVPQATMGIPLASVSKLIDVIRKTEGQRVGIGLTASFRQRLGLRSDALYNAQNRVNNARAFFLKKGVFNGLGITNSNFSDSLAGFLILLAQYFWTSVLPADPRDKEQFSKAYVPLHSKNRFRELFHCLLKNGERELFIKVFWENDSWKNLFSLARKIPGRKGGYLNIADTPNLHLFPSKVTVTKPTWQEFIASIVDNSFSIEKTTGSNTLVTGPTKAIDLTSQGVILELRRMGFGVLPSDSWLAMATNLFTIAKGLNA